MPINGAIIMRHKILSLILLDGIFAVLGYLWLYSSCGLHYGYTRVGLLVLGGPLYVLMNYEILISGFMLRLPNLIFLSTCYVLVFHSHKLWLKIYNTNRCGCLVVAYVAFSWAIYFLTTAYFIYFGWLYHV